MDWGKMKNIELGMESHIMKLRREKGKTKELNKSKILI